MTESEKLKEAEALLQQIKRKCSGAGAYTISAEIHLMIVKYEEKLK